MSDTRKFLNLHIAHIIMIISNHTPLLHSPTDMDTCSHYRARGPIVNFTTAELEWISPIHFLATYVTYLYRNLRTHARFKGPSGVPRCLLKVPIAHTEPDIGFGVSPVNLLPTHSTILYRFP